MPAVGPTSNKFSYYASPTSCRATSVHLTPQSLILCCTSDIAAVGPTYKTSLAMRLLGLGIEPITFPQGFAPRVTPQPRVQKTDV